MEKFDKKVSELRVLKIQDFPNFGNFRNFDFSKFSQFSKFQNFFSRQPRVHLKRNFVATFFGQPLDLCQF
ncbi:hypothetical protein T11_10206 [Trichinella zimbabwensis]|uniref:Uncharacterized protein n=1 Tax=Trichinella zimbabwensis TaxID=268475 RepID=A0A0V1G8D6_9BILA|nr:hypothetical protein T11_10206 [Trichinella zimbabwensis]